MSGLLSRGELKQTGRWIASLQRPNGMIPWYPGGHADPWNHTEAAMALVSTGHVTEAEAAYRWLADTQHADGSWCLYYLAEGIEEPRRDPNVCAYVATGVWWHFLETGDESLLRRMWPVISAAVTFVLGLQAAGGEILWNRDVDGKPGTFALLTANASIFHSLRCAVAIAEHLGHERPDWELAADRVAHAVARQPSLFAEKDRWAMDWYYPVLTGAVSNEAAHRRIEERWDAFVMPGLGVRCVSSNPWVTAAETAECAIALCACGREDEAGELLAWIRHLRCDDGSYWTGCVHPGSVPFPGGERSTYGASAVVMAHSVIDDERPTGAVFRSEVPQPSELLTIPVQSDSDRTASASSGPDRSTHS